MGDLAKNKKNKNCIIALSKVQSEQFQNENDFDDEWIQCEISHGRTSTITTKCSNFEKIIQKTDITPLISKKSETEKRLKLESVKLRKEIKSLQSETTKLKLLKQQQYETKIVEPLTKKLRKQLKERNECLIELEKKKRKLNRIKIKKNLKLKCKKRKLRKLKQEKAKIKQNIG